MTAAEKVHYWMLKYKLQNSELPKSDEILAQLEMAIEYENKTTQK